MTLAVSVMGRRPPNHLVKDGIQGRKPAPAHEHDTQHGTQHDTAGHVSRQQQLHDLDMCTAKPCANARASAHSTTLTILITAADTAGQGHLS